MSDNWKIYESKNGTYDTNAPLLKAVLEIGIRLVDFGEVSPSFNETQQWAKERESGQIDKSYLWGVSESYSAQWKSEDLEGTQPLQTNNSLNCSSDGTKIHHNNNNTPIVFEGISANSEPST